MEHFPLWVCPIHALFEKLLEDEAEAGHSWHGEPRTGILFCRVRETNCCSPINLSRDLLEARG